MPAKSNVTTDHEEIRAWVEERGGRPAAVKRTRGGRGRGEKTGILRIDFPGYSGEQSLEPISWDEFFEKFDDAELAFLCQDTTASGEQSNFNKLVKRDTAETKSRGRRGGGAGKRRGATARRGRRAATSRARNRTSRGRRGTSAGRSRRRKRGAAGTTARGRRSRRRPTGTMQKRTRRRRARRSLTARRRSM